MLRWTGRAPGAVGAGIALASVGDVDSGGITDVLGGAGDEVGAGEKTTTPTGAGTGATSLELKRIGPDASGTVRATTKRQ